MTNSKIVSVLICPRVRAPAASEHMVQESSWRAAFSSCSSMGLAGLWTGPLLCQGPEPVQDKPLRRGALRDAAFSD